MLPWAEKLDYNLLLPEFRGPNLMSNPNCTLACGSDAAITDVLDAIAEALKLTGADDDAIFLLGLSGGGYMSLMVAAKEPQLFRAVGAYVPITDLAAWCEENKSYAPHVRACCSDDEAEMVRRSPITYADRLATANVKIFHGKYDDVVPFSHSMRLFDKIQKIAPASRVFLDVFDGGHQIDMTAAMHWICHQYEKKEFTRVTG